MLHYVLCISLTLNAICATVTDLYLRLFDTLLTNPEKVSHGREGYFIGENGEFASTLR